MNTVVNPLPYTWHSGHHPQLPTPPWTPYQPDRKPSVDEVGHPTSVNARILELRKEKSRDAARSRRGKENYEFYELAKMLPLPAAITSQLDKASIIRLTISYLKLRDFSGHGDPPWNRDSPSSKSVKSVRSRSSPNIAMEIFEHHQGTHILQSLDGFAFALGVDGRFLYISETVSIYLGLSQVEMTGSSVFDYVHHLDHSEMAEQLGMGLSQPGQPQGGIASPQGSDEGATSSSAVSSLMTLNSSSTYKGFERTFCVRMKSTLTKRGCHFKSSGYRVVLLLCRLRPQYQFSHSRKSSPPLLGMVSLAIALPPPSVHEIRLESDMFVIRLTLDFRIAHCEPKVVDLLDYTPDEITGMNLYSLCHGEDANKLRKSHIDLINKGQVLTHYYRLMNKNGGYTWVQTCATVVSSSKNADEQNIICVNYVVSGREYQNLIMDCCQLEDHIATRQVKREEASNNDHENGSPGSDSPEGRSSSGGGSGGTSGGGGPEGVARGELEEDSPEGPPPPTDGRGRGSAILDHGSSAPVALHHPPEPHQLSINNVLSRPVKKLSGEGGRRGTKRKIGEEESSCCSSEDESERSGRKRYPVLSPASSSCHSGLAGSPKGGGSLPPGGAEDPGSDGGGGGGTSVKDLEQAMTKHLPPVMEKTTPTDFSADALLKAQQQRSTIQWIGAHHPALQGTAPLPASTLLRQLYAANRESVIRANVRGPGGAGSYYGAPEMGGTLPTPPGSEGGSYPDQFASLQQSQKAVNDFASGLYGSAGATYTSVDYHTAMTPPSSVSPRDKHQQPGHTGFDSPVYTEVLRHQYLGGSGSDAPAQPLPLKPQPYPPPPVHPLDPYASTTHHHLDQSQFYHHGSASTFHLYHPANKPPGTPPVYPDPLKNSANWYSTPT